MKIKIVIEHDKKSASVEIGAETLHQMLNRIPCTRDNKEFFKMVSEIPSEKIHEMIAQIDTMYPEILQSLSLKDNPNVMRNLLRNDNARKALTVNDARKAIADNYAIESIISSIESFEEIDADVLLKELAEHPSPDIRLMVAENYSTPKKFKKILSKDKDADVRNAAIKALSER